MYKDKNMIGKNLKDNHNSIEIKGNKTKENKKYFSILGIG